jgi:FlaA1/EpsC-like NDP-sugar epimerase
MEQISDAKTLSIDSRFNDMISEKIILITGGTGSFGKTMTKALLNTNVKEIRVMSRHEDLQVQMKREVTDDRIKFFIGDIRDYERCREVTKGVDIIFHAAALKQIAEIERHPIEAIKTNILGTWNIKKAAIENNVKHVVGISTDKAVKPINVYGMTKGIDERILLNDEIYSDTKFSVVRYGNVVGSRGSVIPYWYELAKNGKDLPLTDERMTRFWITLKEAIELVFFSLKYPGKIIVKKCKAFYLRDLAQIYKEEFKVGVKIVGIRPGEKLHECLLSDYEMRKAKSHGNFYVVDLHGKDLRKDANDFDSNNAEKIKYNKMKALLKKEGFL